MLCFVLTFLFNSFIIFYISGIFRLWKIQSFFTIIFDETRDFLEIFVEKNINQSKDSERQRKTRQDKTPKLVLLITFYSGECAGNVFFSTYLGMPDFLDSFFIQETGVFWNYSSTTFNINSLDNKNLPLLINSRLWLPASSLKGSQGSLRRRYVCGSGWIQPLYLGSHDLKV